MLPSVPGDAVTDEREKALRSPGLVGWQCLQMSTGRPGGERVHA